MLERYPESQLLQNLRIGEDGPVQEQGDLQERSGSVRRWLTSILAIFRLELKDQGGLQECWGSAQGWLTLISI